LVFTLVRIATLTGLVVGSKFGTEASEDRRFVKGSGGSASPLQSAFSSPRWNNLRDRNANLSPSKKTTDNERSRAATLSPLGG
jgi:hypothetical protein